MNKSSYYYQYWGKTNKTKDEDDFEYHLLVYHCLDVAAVTWHLMSTEFKRCMYMAKRLGISQQAIQYLVTLLLMIHDLGKFSKSFQGLVPDLFKQLFPDFKAPRYDERHDTLGFLIWRGDNKNGLFDVFHKENESLFSFLNEIIKSGFGHHGFPPNESSKGGNAPLFASTFFDEADNEAVEQFIGECLILLGSSPDFPEMTKDIKKKLKTLSWEIAGLGIIADWTGSDSEIFHYKSDIIPLNDYWEKYALPQAQKAVGIYHWGCIKPTAYKDYSSIFPFIKEPTPLQSLAETIDLLPGPKLFIIEDVTGAGKTEAAMILSARIMGRGEADGFYIGLPTMATANAMYDRMGNVYCNLYDTSEKPSLILSHGARHLSKKFNESVALKKHTADLQYCTDSTASVYCNEWFADNRKKALLADVGVGTIDQALVGILPARHQSLRLLGLQRKILIIDEVHAYDPYMEHLLSVLLKAHAGNGGSVILLSATIPLKKKQELISSFMSGLDTEQKEENIPEDTGYPLLTHVGNGEHVVVQIATRKDVERYVGITFIHDYNDVLNTVIDKSRSGKSVCWIRNTVKDARKAFYDLKCRGIDVGLIDLFHSRFAMVDRTRIEYSVIANFGKNSGEKERTGRVLIATQVVEQSLDLDFDELISDIAPIDLIIQRAGRLHRHIRDIKGNIKTVSNAKDDREEPVMYIHCPVFSDTPDERWLASDFRGTGHVYQNIGILWRTLKILSVKKGWHMPGDARDLIEAVYGESAPVIPGVFEKKVTMAEGVDKQKEAMGYLNSLDIDKGYCRKAIKADQWDEDDLVSTRLTDENKEIALAVVHDNQLLPYADVERFSWDWSTLSVSLWNWKQCNYICPPQYLPLIEKLKSDYPRFKFTEIVLVNHRSDEALKLGNRLSDHYDPHLGWGTGLSEEE